MMTAVTVRFYDSQGELLEEHALEAELTPNLDVPVGVPPPGAARFTVSWPQQTGDGAVLTGGRTAR